MEDDRNDQGPGQGVVVDEILSENVWRAVILTSAAVVILFSIYCLSHGITIIFMHLYYFPIVLLAYRYRYRGFVLATLLAIAYVGLVYFYDFGQADVITGAWYRFIVFVGIGAVVASLSERLAAAHSSQKEGLDIILNLQQFQESVITNANVWITVLASDGTTIIVWNDAAEAISGYKRGEVLGKRTIWRALYPDKAYRREVTREIQRVITRDTYLENFETEIRCADGTQKTIVWNTRGIRDPTGTIQSYIAIGRDITERKRAEEALQAQTNLLTSLINSSSDFIIFSLDREYRYLAFNEMHRKEMQRVWKTDIRIGMSILDCMTDPVLCRAAQESIDRALRGEAFTEVQHQPDPDIWYEFNWNPIRQSTVDIMGVSVFIQDITERKRAEEALQESETLLNEVGGIAHVGGWELDVRTKAVRWTKETYRIHDISEDEKFDLSKAVLFFDLPDRSTLEAALQRCMEKGEPFDLELPFTSAKGRHLWTRAMGRAVSVGGKVVKLTGTFQDITEQRKAEKALRESEQKFRDIFNNTTDAIHLHEIRDDGTPGKFTDINDVASRLLQYTKEEMLAKTPLDITTGYHNPPIETVFEEQRTTGSAKFETEHWRKDGTIIPVEVNTHVVVIDGKKVMLGVVRDITERKKAEALLKQFNEELEQKVKIRTEELNASLDEKVILLREVHHRVNNNLQILISLLNLQSRTITDPQVTAALKESTQRIRAMSMVHEKLYMGRDLTHIEFISYLSSLTKSQVAFYQLDPGKVTIETTGENILLDINTAIPLGLVMNELVSNALKHAFPGDRKGTIRIDAREKADRLEIIFSDNGIGIPEGFDWKTAPSLGLQLVNILIDQISGTIELDRSSGTAFTIVVKEKE
jgi:PAS domain S-box-containing protein